MTLRIVAVSGGDGTAIRLIGHMRAEHIECLRAEITASRAPAELDLEEMTLADVHAVRFLIAVERAGLVVRRCPPFVREWMAREREWMAREAERQ